MLFLKPPFHLIQGAAVFADHADPRMFYYMPAMPHLTTIADPATGAAVPQIQLLRFRGGAGNGGFLTFEVNLGLEQERINAIMSELRQFYDLRDKPILVPVLPEDGSVRLLILDRATAPDGKPLRDAQQQQRFVVRIEHAARPALYGDNQAVFSVELDQDGVQLIEESLLHSELMPIGVVYSLDFLALRPAFTVQVHADWNRVQTHFEESFQANVLFSSTEIDKVVDKLIEDQVVEIQVDSFLPEGEDAGSWVGRRDQAVKEFKDMVLQNFFKPSIEPMKEEKDGWDRFADTAERLALLGATGGWGEQSMFSYVQKDLQRIDQKRINLSMSERVTVRRSIYPQATIKGLARVLRDAQLAPGRFIQDVTLDSPWFEKRSVKAHALVDFEHDQVESVNLTLGYDGQVRTVRLTREAPDGACEWNSALDGNTMRRRVDYEYRVAFHHVDTAERPGELVATGRFTEGDEFEVSPRGEALYFIDDIEIGAGLLPWDRYPQVSVELRYTDQPNRIRLARTFLLTRDKPEATWQRFRLNRDLAEYSVRVTFLSPSRRDVLVDWTTTDQERLIIRDPHPLKRTLQLAPAVDWRLVATLFVELRYRDPKHDIDEQQTLSFFDTPDDRTPKTFSISLADPEQRLVGYAATIVLKDNRIISVPPSMTAGSLIVLRADMAGHRIVKVVPPDVDFGARGLVRIEAHLSYSDPEAGLSYQNRFTFTQPHDLSLFEFDYVAEDRSGYACNVTLVLANGLTLQRDLGQLNADRLELPAG